MPDLLRDCLECGCSYLKGECHFYYTYTDQNREHLVGRSDSQQYCAICVSEGYYVSIKSIAIKAACETCPSYVRCMTYGGYESKYG